MKNLLLCAVLLCAGCVVGTHIVTGTPRPAVLPAGVRIYSSQPTNSEVIGIVTAELGGNDQRSSDKRVEELKRQAGMLGANGVLLGSPDKITSREDAKLIPMGTSFIYIPAKDRLNGTAIFVP